MALSQLTASSKLCAYTTHILQNDQRTIDASNCVVPYARRHAHHARVYIVTLSHGCCCLPVATSSLGSEIMFLESHQLAVEVLEPSARCIGCARAAEVRRVWCRWQQLKAGALRSSSTDVVTSWAGFHASGATALC